MARISYRRNHLQRLEQALALLQWAVMLGGFAIAFNLLGFILFLADRDVFGWVSFLIAGGLMLIGEMCSRRAKRIYPEGHDGFR